MGLGFQALSSFSSFSEASFTIFDANLVTLAAYITAAYITVICDAIC